MLSIAPTLRRVLAVGGAAVAGWLPPPILVAGMAGGTRWGWIGTAAAFALLTLAASRKRLTVSGAVLTQRGAVCPLTVRPGADASNEPF